MLFGNSHAFVTKQACYPIYRHASQQQFNRKGVAKSVRVTIRYFGEIEQPG